MPLYEFVASTLLIVGLVTFARFSLLLRTSCLSSVCLIRERKPQIISVKHRWRRRSVFIEELERGRVTARVLEQ